MWTESVWLAPKESGMNKLTKTKWIVFITIGIIVLTVIGALTVSFLISGVSHRKPIPILSQYNISFCDSPFVVQCKTDTEWTNTSASQVSPQRFCDASLEILGEQADTTWVFHKDRLTELTMSFQLENAEEADAFSDRIEQILLDEYSSKKHFFHEEDEDGSISIGLNYGATILEYTITCSGNTVRVNCLDFW